MSTAAAISVADLRPVDLFDDLDDAQLAEWAAVAQRRRYEPGELLAEQGAEVAGLSCLLEGEAQAADRRRGPHRARRAPDRADVDRRHRRPHRAARSACGWRPRPSCDVALIPADDFRRLALAQPPVHERVMKQMQPVMSRLAGAEQNRERLESLGTMAAGLAHELNNPAAAVKRAASELADALEVISATIGEFVEAGVERADAERLVALQREALARAEEHEALDGLDAADAEDAMLERLEQLRGQRGLAPGRAAGGGGHRRRLADARSHEVAGPATGAALRWVAASLTARGLAAELLDSASRMGDLVTRDQGLRLHGPRRARAGRRPRGPRRRRSSCSATSSSTRRSRSCSDYDRTLPQLTVRGSELNQVWTNLIDNAIDAMGETGTITITTRARRRRACSSTSPTTARASRAEAQPHVLDPFFTTKAVGQGTGLGLDTARQIVEEHHAGTLGFDTGPGGTTFHVWLPIEGTVR